MRVVAKGSTVWDTVVSGRGLFEGELVLAGGLRSEHLTPDGTAAVLITGEDPFAYELASEIADSFENPDAHAVSTAHVTDPSTWLREPSSTPIRQNNRRSEGNAYMAWNVDNADEHKIEYVIHGRHHRELAHPTST